LVIFREIGYRKSESDTLSYIGQSYASLDEFHRAIDYFEQQLVIAQEIGNLDGVGNAFWKMSMIQDILGERQSAIANAGKALEIYEQIEDSDYAQMVREQLAEWRRET
jgi:tetratricopeptide (TPR) repeat protein